MAGTMVANQAVGSASGDDEAEDSKANVAKAKTLDDFLGPPSDVGAAREDEHLEEALQRSMNETRMPAAEAEAAMMKEALERSAHDQGRMKEPAMIQGATTGPEHQVRLMKGPRLRRLKRTRTPEGGIT